METAEETPTGLHFQGPERPRRAWPGYHAEPTDAVHRSAAYQSNASFVI